MLPLPIEKSWGGAGYEVLIPHMIYWMNILTSKIRSDVPTLAKTGLVVIRQSSIPPVDTTPADVIRPLVLS